MAAQTKITPLTAREQEILSCLAGGNNSKTISARLGISFNTVKNHLKHIYKKTGVNTMAQATAWYYKRENSE